jgi:15-cis-phytoene synthase
LERPVFDNFEQLGEYCYRVAGVVGLGSIYVWGFEGGAETEKLAIDRGAAFQLTNILLDLREDAARGRLYLPRQELAAHGLTEEQLLNGTGGDNFDRLMRFQIDRAQRFYDQSAPLESRINRASRPTLVAMTQIYHGLLKKISARPRRVLAERVSLSTWSKLRIGWRAMRAG